MIQLGRLTGDVALPSRQLDHLRAEFRDQHCIRLPALLSAELAAIVVARLETAPFSGFEHPGIGHELCMDANEILAGLHMVVNDGPFLRLIESITGCTPLRMFGGRVYRMVPDAGHGDSWHNDILENRKIGMSVNLSPEPYEGGLFQLREKGSHHLLGEVHNTGLGDAILFRLAGNLEHQVTRVTGHVAKTAFAGWFRPGPEYWGMLRAASGASRGSR